MKKAFEDDYEVIVSGSFDCICDNMKEPLLYPFDKSLINLLRKENKLKQQYYYIRRGGDFAFFVLYENKMNIFTFGKLRLYLKLKVIGYPCSLSCCGYVTSNEEMLFEFIKKIKGAKLVLNAEKPDAPKGFTVGETLPTCVLDNRFASAKDYINALRSPYRRRISRAMDFCKNIDVRRIEGDCASLYRLYLNTYRKSAYKLEKLEKGFFDGVEAEKLGFFEEGALRGFVLLKKDKDKLIFMLCGMDYSRQTADLYYFMLYNIIVYAVENDCRTIDFGQTSEETKMKFGARLEPRYFYAHHTNGLLNLIARLCRGALEYRYAFPEYRVFKEENK